MSLEHFAAHPPAAVDVVVDEQVRHAHWVHHTPGLACGRVYVCGGVGGCGGGWVCVCACMGVGVHPHRACMCARVPRPKDGLKLGLT